MVCHWMDTQCKQAIVEKMYGEVVDKKWTCRMQVRKKRKLLGRVSWSRRRGRRCQKMHKLHR